MRFFNGDFHRDNRGYYPFYMGTGTEDVVDEDSLAAAAEVEVEMHENNEFALKVHAEGKVWDGKYIGVYSAISGYSNKVMSIALLDSYDQTEYRVPDEDGNPSGDPTDTPKGLFKFFTTCNDETVYAPAVEYLHEDVDEAAVPKFLGTAGEYVSIDCKSYDYATDGTMYDLAHLYEHK